MGQVKWGAKLFSSLTCAVTANFVVDGQLYIFLDTVMSVTNNFMANLRKG